VSVGVICGTVGNRTLIAPLQVQVDIEGHCELLIRTSSDESGCDEGHDHCSREGEGQNDAYRGESYARSTAKRILAPVNTIADNANEECTLRYKAMQQTRADDQRYTKAMRQ